jgi:putative flippase GtrA
MALITNYPVAVAVLWLLCDWLRLRMMWASPISMGVLFVWNYATSSWAFWRKDRPAAHG